jgi:hypothetical protein
MLSRDETALGLNQAMNFSLRFPAAWTPRVEGDCLALE